MKCNIQKPTNTRDIQRLQEEICKIRCFNCGAVIKKHGVPIRAIYEQVRRVQLCDKCRGVLTDERAD